MTDEGFDFKVVSRVGMMRAGEMRTPHGSVLTPVFMPVGTQASVKALASDDLERAGATIILANTYHLHLRPGEDVVRNLGKLHTFMQYTGSILTDSGGYQVSSLGSFKRAGTKRLSKITEAGVWFASHIDGSSHFIGPEESIAIQVALGADIIMAFDEATPDNDKAYAKAAMARTHRWLKRCVQALGTWRDEGKSRGQVLFGIAQGGHYKNMRRESVAHVLSYDLPGIALGGASVGQNMEQTREAVDWVRDLLPENKPLYLMGVGTRPGDVIEAIQTGADMFDCVAPTRWARCGLLYTGQIDIAHGPEKARFVSEDAGGRISIEKQQYALDKRPIEPTCQCFTCSQGYSRGYLHHLFKAGELTYYRLASIHNVSMMLDTARVMRQALVNDGERIPAR